MTIQEPTSDQCSNNEKVYEDEHKIGHAVWYPQMGGYVGKAVAFFDKSWTTYQNGGTEGGCIDVLIWHDGQFPFGEGDNPREIHHCDPDQFIEFGKALAEINERGRKQA